MKTFAMLAVTMTAAILPLPANAAGDSIFEAARAGDIAKVKSLLTANPGLLNAHKERWGKYQHDDGFTPLHCAVLGQHMELVELLLSHKAEVNARGRDGRTPLHTLVSDRDALFLMMNFNRYAEPALMTKTQEQLGAREKTRIGIAKLLLGSGADVTAQDEQGDTPLHLTAVNGPKELMRLLLAHKADVAAKNHSCVTPLHVAVWNRRPEIVDLLLSRGAQLDTLTACALGKIDRVTAFLNSDAALVNAQDAVGLTLLHWAVNGCQRESVKLLLERKANPEVGTYYEKWTPLHLAMARNDEAIARLLLAHGAKVNSTDHQGWAPLHIAAALGYTRAAELLLKHEADVNQQTLDEWHIGLGAGPGPPNFTPLHLAAMHGRRDVAELLLRRGAVIDGRDSQQRTPFNGLGQGGPQRNR